MTETETLLNERAKTHGSFAVHAKVTQMLKTVMRDNLRSPIDVEHKEALDMICHKIGRIIAGDANFKDHWDDIAGYAVLGARACATKSSSSEKPGEPKKNVNEPHSLEPRASS